MAYPPPGQYSRQGPPPPGFAVPAYSNSPYGPAPAYGPPYGAPAAPYPPLSRAPRPYAAPLSLAPPPPRVDASCPPGLGYLTAVDQLIVEQQIDALEMFTGWESKNRYLIKNSAGQVVYYAVDESNVLAMNVLGSQRPFDIMVMDNMRACVMRVSRPFRGENLAICGIVQEIQVMSGVGQVLGSIAEVFQWCSPKFQVNNAAGQTILYIEGQVCRADFLDTDFDIITVDGNAKIGAITRKFPGFGKELFTYADVFGVRFPMDLDPAIKAVLLASCFLIDFMFYEKKAEDTNMNNRN